MSITHIPFYPSDWLAGTRGMMADEPGVYITLIARMYEMAGPIERDDERLYRVCGCNSKRHFAKILKFLIHEGKVQEENGELFHQRVAKEINKVIEKSSKARAAANERWGKKPNKNNATENADAMQTDMLGGCQPKPEPYKKEGKPSFVRTDYSAEAMEIYNSYAISSGWPEAQKMTAARKSVINTRVGECGGIDAWKSIMERASNSQHLTGNNDRGWTASLDWMIKSANFVKIMEGNYDNRNGGRNNGNGNNNNQQTRGDAQYDEARERALRIGYAEETPKPGVF